MRVKMLVTITTRDGVFLAGRVVDVEERLAKIFVERGYAEIVGEAVNIESTAIEPPERTVGPVARRRVVKQHGLGFSRAPCD